MNVAAKTSPLWTSDEIAEATGGEASQAFEADHVAFDSREVAPGGLFVALRGETTDGHRFIEQAVASGAAGVVCETRIDAPHVKVADSFAALNALGRFARARPTGLKAFGVTGSAGKTGTKEALFAALDRISGGRAHRSVKSYNNHVGVPLSLARMPQETRYGVFEMGMNHAGELSALTGLVRPDVAVVTTIAPAHIEFFDSIEGIARAKAEIFEGLEPGGTAVIPFDSAQYGILREAAEIRAAEIITFGLGEGADVRAIDWVRDERGRNIVTADTGGRMVSFTIANPGEHWVSNAMAVLAAVSAVGGDLGSVGLALAEMPGLKGRGARHAVALGSGEILLIDESYNANPASMAATLADLGRETASRKIAVLGAMKELGEKGEELHRGLAGAMIEAGVAHAVLVGEEMAPLAEALNGKIPVVHVASGNDAIEAVTRLLEPGDAVLVKGSNSLGLGALVEQLTDGGR